MERCDPIIDFLADEKILDDKTLQEVVGQQQETGESLISILRMGNLLDEDQLTRAIASASDVEFICLLPDDIDPMAAHLISYELATEHNVIPIRRDGEKLILAMSSPLNLSVQDRVEMKSGCKVVPVAATPSAIEQAVHYHFNVANVTKQAIVSMRFKDGVSKRAQQHDGLREPEATADTPITRLVSSIITGAIDARASDIHFEPYDSDMRIRYRVDGFLREALSVPSSAQLELVSHIKILADMDISERRIAQDGHINTRHNGKDYNLRVSSLPSIGGEKIVIRILDKNADKWSLDKIVGSPDDNKRMRDLVSRPYGILLATGPTGSGKSTTLYSLIDVLNTPERNIVTVEDPVEYRMTGITQVQVNPAAGLTFASVLKSILRQDPDVVLVGEIRDFETAEIAISAAQTGHLVLSTLHTNDAAGAISRLADLGVPPFLIASSLLGSIAQRLVRTLCPKCKEPYRTSSADLKRMLGKEGTEGEIELYRAAGCEGCGHSGYRGRKGIFEILAVTDKIKGAILTEKGEVAIKQEAVNDGMRVLRSSAVRDVLDGTTTFEELQRVVDLWSG